VHTRIIAASSNTGELGNAPVAAEKRRVGPATIELAISKSLPDQRQNARAPSDVLIRGGSRSGRRRNGILRNERWLYVPLDMRNELGNGDACRCGTILRNEPRYGSDGRHDVLLDFALAQFLLFSIESAGVGSQWRRGCGAVPEALCDSRARRKCDNARLRRVQTHRVPRGRRHRVRAREHARAAIG
jgi:hypothetical protein